MKMESQPLIYNNNLLESNSYSNYYQSTVNRKNAIVRFFDREFYHFIINFPYFIEVTTNFHLFMKLVAYSSDLLLNEQAPVTMEFLKKHTDNDVLEPLKLMNR
jgi:hypothetical protein